MEQISLLITRYNINTKTPTALFLHGRMPNMRPPLLKEAQGGVTTLKFKEENLTTSHQENKWNTGAVFKVRVEYKSDSQKNEEKYSLESGKLVLTRGKTALATHITNNVSLEFTPTQNGAVGGVFNIGHASDKISGGGYLILLLVKLMLTT